MVPFAGAERNPSTGWLNMPEARSADTFSKGLRSKIISRGRKQDTRAESPCSTTSSLWWPLRSISIDTETAIAGPVSRLLQVKA